MNILITGGAGFIGGNFVHHMVGKYPDYNIIVLDKLTYAGNMETLASVIDKISFEKAKENYLTKKKTFLLVALLQVVK